MIWAVQLEWLKQRIALYPELGNLAELHSTKAERVSEKKGESKIEILDYSKLTEWTVNSQTKKIKIIQFLSINLGSISIANSRRRKKRIAKNQKAAKNWEEWNRKETKTWNSFIARRRKEVSCSLSSLSLSLLFLCSFSALSLFSFLFSIFLNFSCG